MNYLLGMREELEFGISKELKTLVLMSIVHRSPRIHCCAPYVFLLCLRELLEAITRRSLISWFAFNAQRQEKTRNNFSFQQMLREPSFHSLKVFYPANIVHILVKIRIEQFEETWLQCQLLLHIFIQTLKLKLIDVSVGS